MARGSSPSAGAKPAASEVNSLDVLVAITSPGDEKGTKTVFPVSAPSSPRLLHADGGVVELVQHVVDVAAQVHLGTEEVRARPVRVRGCCRVLLDEQFVHVRPLLVDRGADRLLLQLLDQVVDLGEVAVPDVVVVRLGDAIP